MKKVLIVAYSFPPVGGAGVQRPVKFVKYLRRFGWEPVVLTVSNPSVPVIDISLPKDIPEGVHIYRARTLEPSYSTKQAFTENQRKRFGLGHFLKKIISLLLLPDIQVLWWPGLVCKLIKIINSEKPSCIFVTAPPFSSFIPVVAVGKLFGVPVVIDYRDEWAFSRNNWENFSKTRLAFFLDPILERFVLANCRAFTTTTQSYVDSIVKLYDPELKKKGNVITNGYDEDDFIVIGTNKLIYNDPQIITIVYTGTVMRATSLDCFCRLFKQLLIEDKSMRQRIKLKVYGRVVGDEQFYLEDDALKGVIECYGYVEHEIVVSEMLNADILLLTQSDLPGSENMINGKAFEYMASGRHIFALIPDGELRNLISSEYDNATFAHPTNHAGAYLEFLSLLDSIEEVRQRQGRDVSCFLRENLTAKLASVFNGIT